MSLLSHRIYHTLYRRPGTQGPWKVSDISFEPEQGEIHFDLSCEVKRLGCPACSEGDQPIYDRSQRTW